MSVAATALRGPAGGGAGTRPAGPAGTGPRSRGDSGEQAPEARVRAMVRGFVTLFLEVEAGRRPRGHLAALLTPMLYARLSDVWVRGGAPGRVLRVAVTGRCGDGVDLVALVQRGPRCTAIALHLVRGARGWLVDDLALPECGPLPLPAYPVAPDDDEDDELRLLPSPAARPPSPVHSGDWFAGAHPG